MEWEASQMREAIDRIYMQHALEMVRVTPIMRALGMTQHPLLCEHPRKKFTESALRWRCADCLEWL